MFSRKTSLFILSVAVLVIGFLIWWNNVYVSVAISFDPKEIGKDPVLYLSEQERQFPDIKPGLAKQIIWQYPDTKAKTEYSIVYIHGFSASKDEIRPVPDLVASAIGANLHYTRLPGHARTTAAMGAVKVNDYFNNIAEALAIGEAIGNKTIVIATSFGGSLISWLNLTNSPIGKKVEATVLVSPAFELAATGTSLLTYPLAQYYTPLIIGPYRVPNPNARFEEIYAWTNAYPANALLPMADTVKLVGSLDAANAGLPTMFIYDIRDKTSDGHATSKFYEAWGAPKHRLLITESLGNHHVIAGDIVNPANTDLVSTEIITWLKTIGIPAAAQK